MELLIGFFMMGLVMLVGGGVAGYCCLTKINNKLLGFVLCIFAVAIAAAGFEIIRYLFEIDWIGLMSGNINALIN